MRFLLREQPYEKPLVAGRLRYELDGEPTGAVEHWRLTQALDGYQFLRVDLDGRASSGDTYLYNLLLNADGQPEDFRFRFFNNSVRVKGELLFEEGVVTAVRTLNGERYEESRPYEAGTSFFFPSTIGLSLFFRFDPEAETALTLKAHTAVADQFLALEVLSPRIGVDTEGGVVTVGDKEVGTQLMALAWRDQRRTLWLDEYNWPVKMQRQDGLTAVADRYMFYGAAHP